LPTQKATCLCVEKAFAIISTWTVHMLEFWVVIYQSIENNRTLNNVKISWNSGCVLCKGKNELFLGLALAEFQHGGLAGIQLIGSPTRHRLMSSSRFINRTWGFYKLIIPLIRYEGPTSRAPLWEPNLEVKCLECPIVTLRAINIMHDVSWIRMHGIKCNNYSPEDSSWNGPTVIWREMEPI
jgi:hypothetical protein